MAKMTRLCSWFAMTSSKINLRTFLTKVSHNVNDSILKNLCKVQVDTNKCKSYSCSKFRKSSYIYIAVAMLVGKRMPTSPFSHIM